MWINATSYEQFQPGVKFKCYWGSPNLESNFAYEGIILGSKNDLCYEMVRHGLFSSINTGSVNNFIPGPYVNFKIWVDEGQEMEEFLNKLFSVITREWVSGKFCNSGVQNLLNDVIVQHMHGVRTVAALKADIATWLDDNYNINDYAAYLDELEIPYNKLMEIVVKLPRDLDFDSDDFREWLEENCGSHTYVLDIRRG